MEKSKKKGNKPIDDEQPTNGTSDPTNWSFFNNRRETLPQITNEEMKKLTDCFPIDLK